MLNCLYGIFGRKQDIVTTVIVNNKDLRTYLATRVIKNMVPIDDNKTCLLIQDDIDDNLLKELNTVYTNNNFKSKKKLFILMQQQPQLLLIMLEYL